ncbi:MAG: hypothetical protein ACI8R9_002343 [Paraglaciecola sp.]|jgi:hypothetical protein
MPAYTTREWVLWGALSITFLKKINKALLHSCLTVLIRLALISYTLALQTSFFFVMTCYPICDNFLQIDIVHPDIGNAHDVQINHTQWLISQKLKK